MSAAASPLSREEIDAFRAVLRERRVELAGDVELLEDEAFRSSDDEVSVDHMADHGSDSYEKDQTIGLMEREGQALRSIDAALARIDAGRYGLCSYCNGPIARARLIALPYALLCLECQMKVEQGTIDADDIDE